MAKQKETTEAPAEQPKPSTAMLALFQPNQAMLDRIQQAKKGLLERRNMPVMYKPGDCPQGVPIIAKIIKFMPSPVSTVKGKLIWLASRDGSEFTFPLTGVIRNALVGGAEGKEQDSQLEKEIGKWLILVRREDKPSKFKRSMFMFDVFTCASDKELEQLIG